MACGIAGPEAVVTGARGIWVRTGGRDLLNFAGVNYLGLEHRSTMDGNMRAGARDWSLSQGFPRAWAVAGPVFQLEHDLAEWSGEEAALIAPSSLHLLMGCAEALCNPRTSMVVAQGAYAQSDSAARIAAGRGCEVRTFRSDAPDTLESALAAIPASRSKVVLCDSMSYPGKWAHLAGIHARCREHGALLVLDDTLPLGLFGSRTGGLPPDSGRGQAHEHSAYGSCGNGGAAWWGLAGMEGIIRVASMNKAFGVGLAFATGPARLIARLRGRASFLWSSSQPDMASVMAGLDALAVNRRAGDFLRRELAENLRYFTESTGLRGRGPFPAPSWYFPTLALAASAWRSLLEDGIWALLQPGPRERPDRGAAIRFNLSAAHAGPPMAKAWHAVETAKWRCRYAHH